MEIGPNLMELLKDAMGLIVVLCALYFFYKYYR